MPPEQRQKAGRKGLQIHDIVLHRAGVSKAHAHFPVFKFRPEDSRRIQKKKPLIHGDPLLSPGDTGAVLRLGALASGDLIDEGGLSHIGDAGHHDLQRPTYLTLFLIALELLGQHGADGWNKSADALAALAIGLQHRHPLAFKPGRPAAHHGRIRLIDAVEHHQARLSSHNLIQIRIAAGGRDARIKNFADPVHQFEALLHHPAGLGHVAGVPLYVHLLVHIMTPIQFFPSLGDR